MDALIGWVLIGIMMFAFGYVLHIAGKHDRAKFEAWKRVASSRTGTKPEDWEKYNPNIRLLKRR